MVSILFGGGIVTGCILSGGCTQPAAPTVAAKITKSAPSNFYQRRIAYLEAARRVPVTRIRTPTDGPITFPVSDPGKHLWNHIFALLADDPSGNQPVPGNTITVRQLIHTLITYPNMFHFNADGPALCLMRYPDLITPEDRRFLFEGHPLAVLTHDEQPNYNLFTGEGTENHVAMSRFAGYLLCQDWLRDHPDDTRARKGWEATRDYILRHAADVYRAGPGEFNSSTYYGYQMRSMLTCFEYADDVRVRDACRALLDYFATEICLKYVQGVNAGPESRGADETSLSHEINQFVYLWFGDSPAPPTGVTNAVYVALSKYRPPALLEAVAQKQGGVRGQYWNAHPTYLLDRAAIARESLYFGNGFALGCLYLPIAGYTGASAQFRPAKLVCRSREGASAWTLTANSNARSEEGSGRGPYDQWAQYEDVLIQITDVPPGAETRQAEADAITNDWQTRWASSFQRRWAGKKHASVHGPDVSKVLTRGLLSGLIFPRFAENSPDMILDGAKNTVFLRHDDIYIAIRSLKNPLPRLDILPKKNADSDRMRLADVIGDMGTGGFVVEVGNREDDGSFEQFQKTIVEKTTLDISRLASHQEVRYRNRHGNLLWMRSTRTAPEPLIEPLFDWGYIQNAANDHPYSLAQSPPFEQPVYPVAGASREGWGRVPSVTVDNKPLGGKGFLDLAKPWPVFLGPNVTLDDRVLTIRNGKKLYRVDYSKNSPIWSESPL
ncbi:MAG: hypothetical protein H8F28_05975 [Fibrella sp.]|nr:hypothetical protein [Armatimonadota bacterium]